MGNIVKIAVSAALLVVPGFAFAQTDDQIRTSIVQQLLSTFVVQVNSLDKIQSLIAQASDQSQFSAFTGLVAQQLSETTAQLATLLNPSQQNQLPTYGGVSNNGNNTNPSPSPSSMSDQSQIVVTQVGFAKPDPANNIEYGEWSWKVVVLGSDGKPLNHVRVVPAYPADNLYTQIGRTKDEEDAGAKTINGVGVNGKDIKSDLWYVGFTYHPTTPGAKTITFTAGNLTQTIDLTI